MTYVPVRLAKGIVYNNFFYVPLSPIDKKMGRDVPCLLLEDGRKEIVLARSSRVDELAHFSFARSDSSFFSVLAQTNIDYQRKQLLDALGQQVSKGEVEDFVQQIRLLRTMFHEDTHGCSIDEATRERFRVDADLLAQKATKADQTQIRTFQPYLNQDPVSFMFDHIIPNDIDLYSLGFSDVDIDRMRHSEDERRATAKKILQKYVQENLFSSAVAIANYVRFNTNDFSNPILLFLKSCVNELNADNCGLYFSWDKEHPIKIISKDPKVMSKKKFVSITDLVSNDKERFYIQNDNVAPTQLRTAVLLYQIAQKMSRISDQTFVQNLFSNEQYLVNSMFPIEWEHGKISLEPIEKKVVKSEILFPHYAAIDIEKPENAFIMEPGVVTFKHKFDKVPQPAFVGDRWKDVFYSVKSNNGEEYDHFFGSHVCGYRPVVEVSSSMTFVQHLWENYQALFAVLTNGMKSSGYSSISYLRNKYTGKPVTIDGHTFDSKYLPVTRIHEFNASRSQHKQLFIGDGRIT